jgi:hypothetical protein
MLEFTAAGLGSYPIHYMCVTVSVLQVLGYYSRYYMLEFTVAVLASYPRHCLLEFTVAVLCPRRYMLESKLAILQALGSSPQQYIANVLAFTEALLGSLVVTRPVVVTVMILL